MRVMWIVGRMPTDAAEAIGVPRPNRGGWQDALLGCMRAQTRTQLLVAYAGSEPGRRMSLGGVELADVGPLEPAGRIARVAARWQARGGGPAVLDECVRLVGEWAPDVIHVHGTESGLGLIADRVDAPVLVSIQGVLSVYEAAARDHASARLSSLSSPSAYMRGLSPWHLARRMHTMAELERLMLRKVCCVVGRTAFDERVAAVLAPQASYLHVGEVLREAFYGPRWEGRPSRGSNAPVLCVSGTEYGRKGVDTAIEAVKILSMSGRDVRLNIFGVEAESTTGGLASAHAKSLGIAGMVHLSGSLTASEVVAGLLGTDVFMLPSRADNSPNTLCEAMMLGVPCVASTAGGIPSLATDGEDALLVPPGDAYSLAGAVSSVLADPELATRLSKAAHERACARHDPATVTQQLLEAYAATTARWQRLQGADRPPDPATPSGRRSRSEGPAERHGPGD